MWELHQRVLQDEQDRRIELASIRSLKSRI
jgi:hypothetical protein